MISVDPGRKSCPLPSHAVCVSANDMVSTTICVRSGTNLGRLASHALHVGGLYLLLPSKQHLCTTICVRSGTSHGRLASHAFQVVLSRRKINDYDDVAYPLRDCRIR